MMTQERPATAKQKQYVRDLLAERAGKRGPEGVRKALNEMRRKNSLTSDFLSACITALLAIPKNETLHIEAGVYVLPNRSLVRVYFGRNSGGLLAKIAIDGSLVYGGTAARVLVPGSRKATTEEIGNWGRATGTCLICSRRLDDPESVDRGIGPVCYSRL